MQTRIVVDTSVFVAALIGPQGPNREILRLCLRGRYMPLISNALFAEYEDVSSREAVLRHCPVSRQEVRILLNALYSVCEWVPIYYLWRPNLTDESDNHLLELAMAGNAQWIATNNVRDFADAELRFPDIRIRTPEEILKED